MTMLLLPISNAISKALKLVRNSLFFSQGLQNGFFHIGLFNVSILVTNQYGRSLTSRNLYRVSADENLYTFQSYAGLYSH